MAKVLVLLFHVSDYTGMIWQFPLLKKLDEIPSFRFVFPFLSLRTLEKVTTSMFIATPDQSFKIEETRDSVLKLNFVSGVS